jgi:hypothetical protein
MTAVVRRRSTGTEVEVLAFTADDLALIAPLGHRELAILVARSDLEPDVAWDPAFRSWTEEGAAEA